MKNENMHNLSEMISVRSIWDIHIEKIENEFHEDQYYRDYIEIPGDPSHVMVPFHHKIKVGTMPNHWKNLTKEYEEYINREMYIGPASGE